MTQRETPILHAIRAALARSGHLGMLWRVSGGVDKLRGIRYGLGKGAPDLCGLLLSGRLACWEIKAPAGRLSKDQRLWHARARQSGAFVAVARTPESALAALDRALAGASQ